MHELSIALKIVDIASEEAKHADAHEITEMDLDVGSLSGVVVEALDFALKEAVKNTALENALIHIHEIQAEGLCNQCGHEYQVSDLYEPCPRCKSMDRKLLKGKELQVRSIKVP